MVPTGVLVDVWRTWQVAQSLSERTITARLMTVERLSVYSKQPAEMAEAEQITDFLASIGSHQRSTLATYYAHLKAYYVWLCRMDYRSDNPIHKVAAPKVPRRRPRPVTDRELVAILNTRMHRRTRMMILLGAFQGLRVHEIAKVRGEDVNLLDGQLRVIGKGGVDVVLPLHPMVAKEAARYPRKGVWFPTYVGNRNGPAAPILAQSVTQLVGAVFNRAGVQGGAHRLRHWYGTTLVAQGVNIRIVQELLRHESLETTQIYTQVTFTQQRDAIELLDMPVQLAALA